MGVLEDARIRAQGDVSIGRKEASAISRQERDQMDAEAPLVPAAQYLRMSTEHQRYSLENQATIIAASALANGFNIVATYSDPGKSGLTLSGRPGLRQLLADVVGTSCPFSAVLVLDVSRWGRFQDPDQAAHYEYLCREAGAPVVYCNETFEGDRSFAAAIMKQLKRVMAGEYSRELAEKVRYAQVRQAGLGFKQGGPRPYGVERVLLDGEGNPRTTLRRGQQKALREQRVVHVRGSDEEADVIRRIFDDYLALKLSMSAIARRLNGDGVPTPDEGRWSHFRVRKVLTSEFAIGNYVFNRTCTPLKGKMIRNAPENWVRVRVMEGIVTLKAFAAAQRRIDERARPASEEELLLGLRRLLDEKGVLSGKLIKACRYTPAPSAYEDRFGSLTAAYARLGYVQKRRWERVSDEVIFETLRQLHAKAGHLTEKIINADNSTPAVHVLQLRFGGLSKAYQLAGLPHDREALRKAGIERGKQRR